MSQNFEETYEEDDETSEDTALIDTVAALAEEQELGFEQWLTGSSGAQRSVEVLQDGSLMALWDTWVRKYQRAVQAQEETDDPDEQYSNPNNGLSELEQLEVEGKLLLDQIDAARTTWYVTGIQREVEQDILDRHEAPVSKVPKFLKRKPVLAPKPNQAQAEAFLKALTQYGQGQEEHLAQFPSEVKAHERAAEAYLMACSYEKIAAGFVKATDRTGKVLFTKLTAENVKQLHQRLGSAFFVPVIETITEITDKAAAIPGESDFLSVLSGNGPDSDGA